jgi:CRISPR-associated protein Cas5d
MGTHLKVKVWGDWACFSRPEMKVERVSYEVMTPSAARGVLEAIFWKPAFQWRVHKIHVLNPIRRMSLRRTEVKTRTSLGGSINSPSTPDRTRRNTLALRNVAYLIEADVHLVGYGRDEHPAKYRDQFRRRVDRGQCFFRPYLGCREFAARFSEPEDGEEKTAIGRSEDLGRMFFGWRYDENYASAGVDPDEDYIFSDEAEPVFFDARLEDGTLVVPDKYDELKPR